MPFEDQASIMYTHSSGQSRRGCLLIYTSDQNLQFFRGETPRNGAISIAHWQSGLWSTSPVWPFVTEPKILTAPSLIWASFRLFSTTVSSASVQSLSYFWVFNLVIHTNCFHKVNHVRCWTYVNINSIKLQSLRIYNCQEVLNFYINKTLGVFFYLSFLKLLLPKSCPIPGMNYYETYPTLIKQTSEKKQVSVWLCSVKKTSGNTN